MDEMSKQLAELKALLAQQNEQLAASTPAASPSEAPPAPDNAIPAPAPDPGPAPASVAAPLPAPSAPLPAPSAPKADDTKKDSSSSDSSSSSSSDDEDEDDGDGKEASVPPNPPPVVEPPSAVSTPPKAANPTDVAVASAPCQTLAPDVNAPATDKALPTDEATVELKINSSTHKVEYMTLKRCMEGRSAQKDLPAMSDLWNGSSKDRLCLTSCMTLHIFCLKRKIQTIRIKDYFTFLG